MKPRFLPIVALGSLLFGACERDQAPSENIEASPVEEIAEAPPEVQVSEGLGFAIHVPADADLFLQWRKGEEMIRGFFSSGLVTNEVLTLEEDESGEIVPVPDGEDGDPDEEIAEASIEESVAEVAPFVGDEAFLFVGNGVGEQLEMLAAFYRDLSAATSGTMFGMVLDGLAGELSFEELGSEFENPDLFNGNFSKLLDVMEDDSRLRFPSVVAGWKPAPSKHQEIMEGLDELFSGETGDPAESPMEPVEFEHQGIVMKGLQGRGAEAFGEMLAEARETIEEEGLDAPILAEDIERLMEAIEGFDFTVAYGSHDGYVLLYLGNGEEGFQLAPNPEASLANAEALKWTDTVSNDDLIAFAYLSEAMMASALPLIEQAPTWDAMARTIDPELEDFRETSALLVAMADIERDLAKREVHPWSGLMVKDEGLRIESRGGWTDPGLDYETPLAMFGAADAADPVFRVHWVQNRERKDLSWKRWETIGMLFDLNLSRLLEAGMAAEWIEDRDSIDFFIEQIRQLNLAYRDDFRGGIGDEVGIIGDFDGVTPPIPGVEAEVIEQLKMPRFVLARPVTDYSLISASGKAVVGIWEDTIFEVNKRFDWKLPPLAPQMIESNELTTHYFPLGVTGGDFIPGLYLNDRVWLISTSRSMADGFSKQLTAEAGESAPTGVLIEVDIEKISQWVRESLEIAGEDAELGLEESLEPLELATPEMEEAGRWMGDWFRRLRSYRYHHRMEDGVPRTSHHLHLAPAS
ncbi:MAG: hypothetical protein AAGI48_08065 [Verrucomicrobiota bacterium]